MKKLLPFIVLSLLLHTSLSNADDLDPLVNLLKKPHNRDIVSLFKLIDKDEDDMISHDELIVSKANKNHSPIEKLLISSLIKNYGRMSHLFSGKNTDNGSLLTVEDMKIYYIAFSKDKMFYRLIEGVNSISDGLLPEGISSISHENVYQGQIGDSGFISALASMAYKKPEEIYSMLTENQDGSFDVKSPVTDSIKITPTLEAVYLGASSNYHGYWPLALEFSFFEWINQPSEDIAIWFLEQTTRVLHSLANGLFSSKSFDIYQEVSNIENEIKSNPAGSQISSSIYFLTGNPSRTISSQMVSTEESRDLLSIIQSENRIAVATLENIDYKRSCIDSVDITIISSMLCKKELDPSLKTLKLHNSYHYSILNYNSLNNTVLVRSPWGFGEQINLKTGTELNRIDDGIFELTLEEFRQLFDSFTFESSYTRI